MKTYRVLAVALLAWYLIPAAPAAAVPFTFSCITNTNLVNCATGTAQLTVDVTAQGTTQVQFKFSNSGPLASSITDIYFDNNGTLGSFSSITDGPGVNFEPGASPPNLPSGENANPDFVADFSFDSEPPAQANGVNPGEFVSIFFNLATGKTFDNTLVALGNSSLRIGIHVQGFANGGSESFINNPQTPAVPEPSSLLLLGSGLAGLGLWRRARGL